MNALENLDTKEKILITAQELFAQKGYNGASIRDIAQKADVNIAAINYHFKNKENLYLSTFELSHNILKSAMEELYNQSKDLDDLMLKAFDFLYENSKMLKSAMMSLLSDSFPDIEDELKQTLSSQKEMGPPGGEYIFKMITKEVGEGVPDELKLWGVENLFSSMIHFVLMMSGSNCQKIYGDHPMFTVEYRKKSILHHTKAVISYLKDNKKA